MYNENNEKQNVMELGMNNGRQNINASKTTKSASLSLSNKSLSRYPY